MLALPFEKFTLMTSLTILEIQAKLLLNVETTHKAFLYYKTNKPYKGKIGDNGFKIMRITNGEKSLLPIVKGKFIEQENQTAVKVSMRLNNLAAIFMLIWLSGTLIGGIYMLGVTLFTGSHTLAGLILLGLFLFGYLFCIFSFNNEAEKAKAFVNKMLEK